MKIATPVHITEIGNRDTNEDTVHPLNPTKDHSLFLVCDGVGGQRKGEVASSLVCKYMAEFMEKTDQDPTTFDFLSEALRYTEQKFMDHISSDPALEGMASTLTLVKLYREQGAALIGWIGDSRVYHIRNGEVIYRTKDHSEIQNLLDMGEITPEEAENHPRKHVITRAVSGIRPTRIDHTYISDIAKDDFFLLCTDGILENLDESKIKKWFLEDVKVGDIRSKILETAHGNTKDNYSMILIKVKEVDIETTRRPSEVITASEWDENAGKNWMSKKNLWATIFILVLLGILVIYMLGGPLT